VTKKKNSIDWKPTLLTMVASAGLDPWLAVEERAQRPIIEAYGASYGRAIWFRANPEADTKLAFFVLARLVRVWLQFPYSNIRAVRFFSRFSALRRGNMGILTKVFQRVARESSPPLVSKTDENIVNSSFPTHIDLAGLRTIEMLRFAIENYEFDYLLRLTSTCLPVPVEIEKILKRLPRRRVFGGQISEAFNLSFLSGAALFFSRDVVEEIVKNSDSFRFGVFEDVALSLLVKEKDLADFLEIPYLNVGYLENLSEIGRDDVSGFSVLRCKRSWSQTNSADEVVSTMSQIEAFLGTRM